MASFPFFQFVKEFEPLHGNYQKYNSTVFSVNKKIIEIEKRDPIGLINLFGAILIFISLILSIIGLLFRPILIWVTKYLIKTLSGGGTLSITWIETIYAFTPIVLAILLVVYMLASIYFIGLYRIPR
ncbi:membrane hypothetical protein [Nitrospina gracilis 3/211]|uniref:Uncharacterized protein n=1 Tax=Nitrospina gracilis (strain 3/211) TaxID=1266370 RepID=M1YXS6_NITG3|nr:membrane hypothetical protein [Nitrospina gracilis 3/211]